MILNFLNNPTILIVSAIVMVMALIFHNMVQTFVAARYGDHSARFAGYGRFDPQQQLEPMGVLLLFLLGFGWPKTIPVNSRNYSGRGRGEAWVWYSGPLTYLVVAFLSVLIGRIFFAFGEVELYSAFRVAAGFAVLHAVINLFPVYPLDGAKAALAWGNADVRRLVQQLASFGILGFFIIFLVLSFTGILGRLQFFFLNIINSIISFIPGL